MSKDKYSTVHSREFLQISHYVKNAVPKKRELRFSRPYYMMAAFTKPQDLVLIFLNSECNLLAVDIPLLGISVKLTCHNLGCKDFGGNLVCL